MPLDLGYVCNLVDLCYDISIVRCNHLGPVFPICLVSVVNLRVMGCSQHHATLTSIVTDGVAEFRSRPQLLCKINVETIGFKYLSDNPRKIVRVVAAIVSDGNLDLPKLPEALLKIVGKTLGSHSHRVAVHAVATGPHYASEATRTKLQGLVKRILKFLRITINQSSDLILSLLVITIAEPLLSFFQYPFIHKIII